jgi:hypothetical protein
LGAKHAQVDRATDELASSVRDEAPAAQRRTRGGSALLMVFVAGFACRLGADQRDPALVGGQGDPMASWLMKAQALVDDYGRLSELYRRGDEVIWRTPAEPTSCADVRRSPPIPRLKPEQLSPAGQAAKSDARITAAKARLRSGGRRVDKRGDVIVIAPRSQTRDRLADAPAGRLDA